MPHLTSFSLHRSPGPMERKGLKEAVGRILYPEGRRPFIWAARHRAARAAYPGATSTEVDCGDRHPRPPYSALLRMGFTVPPPSPEGRCALTAPFHPYPRSTEGGLLSAALSLALPRPGVTRHASCRGVRTFLCSSRSSGHPPPSVMFRIPSVPLVGPPRRSQGVIDPGHDIAGEGTGHESTVQPGAALPDLDQGGFSVHRAEAPARFS